MMPGASPRSRARGRSSATARSSIADATIAIATMNNARLVGAMMTFESSVTTSSDSLELSGTRRGEDIHGARRAIQDMSRECGATWGYRRRADDRRLGLGIFGEQRSRG